MVKPMNGYYSDGITKYTDPLWTIKCNCCGHITWGVIYVEKCSKCGSNDIECKNRNIQVERNERNKVS